MSRADVLNRVRLLSQAQRRTLAERLVRDSGNARRMVATWSGSASPAALQAHIDDTLAPYMRPHRLCKVDALPRTPNGKVDYAALQALCAQSRPAEGPDRTLSTAAEWSWLADIWRQVLGVADVSAHDSFFDLGGDSILGLRVVARARRAGYPLTVSDIFEFPVLVDLAEAAVRAQAPAPTVSDAAHQGLLTPIEHWFFELPRTQRHHWNMPLALCVRPEVNKRALIEALHCLYDATPELRSGYFESGSGWLRREPADAQLVVDEISTDDLLHTLKEASGLFQKTLNLERGPLFRAVLIEDPQGGRVLLLIAHHLVVDAVSWHILIRLLEQAYSHGSIESVSRTNPAQWQSCLRRALERGDFDEEVGYWKKQLPDAAPAEGCPSAPEEFSAALDAERTTHLLHGANVPFGTVPEELLLCALALALNVGREETIHLEHHGRSQSVEGADLSSAIGWFTALFPLRLPSPDTDRLDVTIQAIKEQRRAVPRDGLGFGAIRYCHPQEVVREQLAAPDPPVLFNYFGLLEFGESGVVFGGQMAPRLPIASARGDARPTYRLEVNCHIADGELQVNGVAAGDEFGYGFGEAFVEQLAQLLDFCMARSNRTYTPSDFPEARLTQDDLDDLLDALDR